MRTLRHAAELLQGATSTTGLAAIAATLGFTAPAEPVDDAARERLRLPPGLVDVHVVRGSGALRALLVVAAPDHGLRAQVTAIAATLARETAHVLWVVIASAGDEVAVACWTSGHPSLRLAALVANRRRIVASDAEALGVLAASCHGDDLLVHARWCEVLGRDALTRRFYRTLAQRVAALAQSLRGVPPAEAAELALLTTSRLLFLSFLQARGWLNEERAFLATRFDECMARGGAFHGRVLLPLFFGTLNTPRRHRAARAREFGAVPFLNGGLFTRTALERRYPAARFTDEAMGELFGQLLGAYRFTAREDDPRWSEVAIDPEMLGRAFESLMASHERRASGTFYTPQALVAHVADEGLVVALADDVLGPSAVRDALHGVAPQAEVAERLRARLRHFTVLDPACGSGAFLVHLLERITTLHRAAGDARPGGAIRRDVLARSIHGVDVNPTAVWLCELRLWLCVVIESEDTRIAAITPLPNLDANIRIGDALTGASFVEPPSLVGPSAALARLRERYARAAGARKAPLRRALDREERHRAVSALERKLVRLTAERRERVVLRRAPDLFGGRRRADAHDVADAREVRRQVAALRRERQRLQAGGALPFSFPSHFGHVHASGGFSLVVGNPPWVRLHNIPRAARADLRARFGVFLDAGWQPDVGGVQAARGFGAQVDLAALFVERSVTLLRATGILALLVPAKLWRSLSGGSVRRLLATRTTLHRVEDWSDAPCSFDAAVYPSVLIASCGPPPAAPTPTTVGVRRGTLAMEWQSDARAVRYASDAASPWLLLPRDARAAFDRLARRGTPLGACAIGRPTLGVKCGVNDAFLLEVGDEPTDAERSGVRHQGRSGAIERALLRPLLRGESLTAWRVTPSSRAILWTHAADGTPLGTLPAGAARWLSPWRQRLAARSDLHGAREWWMLFRTEAADCTHPRVVWGDFGRVPRAALLPAGEPTVPLNSCYVLPCPDLRDALAMTALFNSPVAAAWLNVLAEPARGGWHRYLAWTVTQLPLPADWARAREILAPLAERALLGAPPGPAELMSASCAAYRVRSTDLAPLLAWSR